jgi:hypothetical protein
MRDVWTAERTVVYGSSGLVTSQRWVLPSQRTSSLTATVWGTGCEDVLFAKMALMRARWVDFETAWLPTLSSVIEMLLQVKKKYLCST